MFGVNKKASEAGARMAESFRANITGDGLFIAGCLLAGIVLGITLALVIR